MNANKTDIKLANGTLIFTSKPPYKKFLSISIETKMLWWRTNIDKFIPTFRNLDGHDLFFFRCKQTGSINLARLEDVPSDAKPLSLSESSIYKFTNQIFTKLNSNDYSAFDCKPEVAYPMRNTVLNLDQAA